LDMCMPVLDGWGVAASLRQHNHWVPTVVVTAAEDARRWCAEIQADAWVRKPFDIEDLLSAVEHCLRNVREAQIGQRRPPIQSREREGSSGEAREDPEPTGGEA
jgi:DNA-binding response OmpR family regulator